MPKQKSFLTQFRQKIIDILHSGSSQNERPFLKKDNESNIPGLFIIGDLAGAPVIKYAMAQGHDVIEHIAALPGAIGGGDGDLLDVVIIGGGAAGLNAALQAKERGMKSVVLEKEKIANTIENFPEGKWVYAEPDTQPPKGKLWLDGATKEDLIKKWHQIVDENKLDIRKEEGVEGVEKKDGIFHVKTSKGEYRSKRVVLATGQRGNPRKLNVPGEDQRHVYHRLYSPRKYKDENILVIGGGNSAVEAAITLSEQNKVYLSYRKGEFGRIFKDNERELNEQIAAGKIEPIFHS
ncbi:NAD(P)-binding domain-containing protein [candidate division KSB1 bacterium]|nr:NAD(P)-binding domain-containing protein [candidate division KSB1 bacterium]